MSLRLDILFKFTSTKKLNCCFFHQPTKGTKWRSNFPKFCNISYIRIFEALYLDRSNVVSTVLPIKTCQVKQVIIRQGSNIFSKFFLYFSYYVIRLYSLLREHTCLFWTQEVKVLWNTHRPFVCLSEIFFPEFFYFLHKDSVSSNLERDGVKLF